MPNYSEEELYTFTHEWYTVANDLVGGFAITTYNAPLSYQEQFDGYIHVADVWSEAIGKWICQLHNLYVKMLQDHMTVEVDRSKGADSPDPS